MDEILGKRLQVKRKELGISQQFLAELLHREQTSISKMEKGLRQISVVEFLNWSKALNLSVEEMTSILKIGPYKE